MLSRAALKFMETFEYGKSKSKDKRCDKCLDNTSFKNETVHKCICHGMYHLKGTLFDKTESFQVAKDHVCKCFKKKK